MTSSASTSFTATELIRLVGGTLVGNPDVRISNVNRIGEAQAHEVSFISSDSYAKFLSVTQAGVVFISEHVWKGALAEGSDTKRQRTDQAALIIVPDAYRSFVAVMREFFPPLRMTPGLRHPSAIVHPTATIHSTACIGPGCTIDAGCTVGERTMLYANVSLYEHVTIGADTIVHANVVCTQGTRIGDRCIIHAGAVLGADGFGFFENADGSFEKIPQVGVVVVEDDVEIGANTTIDRAAVGETRIESGVKLDNLIHIAHGVVVGKHTAIAAQAGISGSTRLGERNRIAGQVGIVGHITTEHDVVVEAQSGVSKSIATPGHYFGSPAKDHRTALRMEAAFRQLPDLLKQVRELQKEIAELKGKLDE